MGQLQFNKLFLQIEKKSGSMWIVFAVNIYSLCLSEASVCTIPSQAKVWAEVFLFNFLTKGKRTLHVSPCGFRVGSAPWVSAWLGEVCRVTVCQEAATRTVCPRKKSQCCHYSLPFDKIIPAFSLQWNNFLTCTPMRKVWFCFFILDLAEN